jgi:hypothetical protein
MMPCIVSLISPKNGITSSPITYILLFWGQNYKTFLISPSVHKPCEEKNELFNPNNKVGDNMSPPFEKNPSHLSA